MNPIPPFLPLGTLTDPALFFPTDGEEFARVLGGAAPEHTPMKRAESTVLPAFVPLLPPLPGLPNFPVARPDPAAARGVDVRLTGPWGTDLPITVRVLELSGPEGSTPSPALPDPDVRRWIQDALEKLPAPNSRSRTTPTPGPSPDPDATSRPPVVSTSAVAPSLVVSDERLVPPVKPAPSQLAAPVDALVSEPPATLGARPPPIQVPRDLVHMAIAARPAPVVPPNPALSPRAEPGVIESLVEENIEDDVTQEVFRDLGEADEGTVELTRNTSVAPVVGPLPDAPDGAEVVVVAPQASTRAHPELPAHLPSHLRLEIADPAGRWEVDLNRHAGAMDLILRGDEDLRLLVRDLHHELRLALETADTRAGEVRWEAPAGPAGEADASTSGDPGDNPAFERWRSLVEGRLERRVNGANKRPGGRARRSGIVDRRI